LVKAQEDSTHTIYFDGQIPMDADFDFINSIKNELASMENEMQAFDCGEKEA